VSKKNLFHKISGKAAKLLAHLVLTKEPPCARHHAGSTGGKQMKKRWRAFLKAWFRLSRLPFHSVGVMPFVLGTVLAWKLAAAFDASVFVLGIVAVMLIMLSTYHAGEYADIREDEISRRLHRNKFAGGSGVMPEGDLPRAVAFWTSIFSLAAAGLLGLILQFYFKTGDYTLLLGCLGALPGFFYSTRPIRLVERGLGELFIAFCYGWLPVACAYYIQTATIRPVIHWISLPIGLSIFNVILLNEFPDYEADMATGKRNLLQRAGKKTAVVIYAVSSVMASLAVCGLPFCCGVPFRVLYFYAPVFAVALFIVVMMLRGQYKDPKTLESLCGLNIIVNLGTSFSFLLAYL